MQDFFKGDAHQHQVRVVTRLIRDCNWYGVAK